MLCTRTEQSLGIANCQSFVEANSMLGKPLGCLLIFACVPANQLMPGTALGVGAENDGAKCVLADGERLTYRSKAIEGTAKARGKSLAHVDFSKKRKHQHGRLGTDSQKTHKGG